MKYVCPTEWNNLFYLNDGETIDTTRQIWMEQCPKRSNKCCGYLSIALDLPKTGDYSQIVAASHRYSAPHIVLPILSSHVCSRASANTFWTRGRLNIAVGIRKLTHKCTTRQLRIYPSTLAIELLRGHHEYGSLGRQVRKAETRGRR